MKKTISIVIPLYNEEAVFNTLHEELTTALDALPNYEFDIVYVDDGSSDGTYELMQRSAVHDSRVLLIKLARNFGHQSALGAGLDFAKGDAVITMDGDLQDSPEHIASFLHFFDQGFDVVYVVRSSREGVSYLRHLYALYYRLLKMFSCIEIPVDSGDFGLMSRRVVDAITCLPERHRFYRGLRSWVGFKQMGLTVDRPARHAGKSKYTSSKLLQLAFDGIFSFSILPLRIVSFLGFLTIVLSLLFTMYNIYIKVVYDASPTGFTALITAFTFLSGVQLLSIGVIGEYVGRSYEQSKLRPLYLIDTTFQSSESKHSDDHE